MPTQSNLELFKDHLKTPTKIFPATHPNSTVTIVMKTANVQLHSDLPLTTVWGYNGTFPGPTIEVTQGHKIHIEWKNSLTGELPLTAVTAPDDTQLEAGTSEAEPMDISKIEPFTVVHLHGAKTHPDSDGWTENGVMQNQSLFYTYENKDKATMFWYHDHAMGVTRFNVYTGLAGLYIVRDPEESALNLPDDGYEIPLVLQDRNLETDDNGDLTGRLLHKVEDGTMEFFGPFNLVNGQISPHLKVKRKLYRFRMVNGSNARTYKLKLMMDDAQNTPFTTPILTQIGSDGGLFSSPVHLPENKLILAPGERADIIADFTGVDIKGESLNWVNCASAPFDGNDVVFSNPKTLDDDREIAGALRQKNACIMQFRVSDAATVTPNFTMPPILSPTFVRATHKNLPKRHNHRTIALVEEEFRDSKTNSIIPMLKLRELAQITVEEAAQLSSVPDAFTALINGQHFKSVASMFYDPISFMIRFEEMEVWKIINLTGDTHPFHVHLVQFQAIGRRRFVEDVAGSDPASDPTIIDNYVNALNFRITFQPPEDATKDSPEDNLMDENERGWKDTIRVNPNEQLSIAMKFDGHCGRYMYHCHLLEHEDREMMRPIVVLPNAILDSMNMGGGHHH